MCTSKMITALTKYDGQPHLTSFDYYTYPRIIPSLKLAMHFLDLINWLNMINSVVRKEANILWAVIFYAITSKCNGHDRYAFRFLWTHHVIRLLLHFLRCYSQSGIRHLRCLTKIRFPVASLYTEYISHHHILKVLIVKLVFHVYSYRRQLASKSTDSIWFQ